MLFFVVFRRIGIVFVVDLCCVIECRVSGIDMLLFCCVDVVVFVWRVLVRWVGMLVVIFVCLLFCMFRIV